MTNSQIFIDTNILVYFKTQKSQYFELTNNKLMSLFQNNKLFFSNQIVKEFLVTMTRLMNNNDKKLIERFLGDIHYFTEEFNLVYENGHSAMLLLNLINTYQVKGKQIHDANIVAVMQAYDIKYLFTHNVKDFQRFGELINIIPLAE